MYNANAFIWGNVGMSDKCSLNRFLGCIYGYTFFNALLFLEPVYAVFMQSHGVSDFGISVLLMLWSGGVLLTQLPVAHIARRFGAKNIMLFGLVLKALAVIMWLLWPCLSMFAVGMLMWGVQGAIYNVVSEDVLYDEVCARSDTLSYESVLSRRKNIDAIGAALSSAGSLLMFFGYEWVTALSVLAIVGGMISVMRMHLVQEYRGINNNAGAISKSVKSAVQVMCTSPSVIVMLVITVLVTNFSYLDDYLSLIGFGIGIPVQFIGVVPFFIMLCQVVGQSYAHKFTWVRPMWLYVMILFVGVLFGIFAMNYSLYGLIALGVAYAICACLKILLFSRFQNMLPARNRMEILSFYSIADQTSYLFMSLIIGLGATLGSWRYSIAIMSGLLIILGVCALLFGHRRASSYCNRCTICDDVPSTTIRPCGCEII